MRIIIRDAEDADLSATLEIYNDLVAETTVTWALEPESLEGRRNWVAARRHRGFPVLVAVDEDSGVIAGIGTYGDFRDSLAKPGYRYTVEHSIHIRKGWCGHNIGALLLEELVNRARLQGMHVIVAVVDGENEGSIRFHKRHGFTETARMPEIGRKFDRWLDLVILQRLIDGPGSSKAVLQE